MRRTSWCSSLDHIYHDHAATTESILGQRRRIVVVALDAEQRDAAAGARRVGEPRRLRAARAARARDAARTDEVATTDRSAHVADEVGDAPRTFGVRDLVGVEDDSTAGRHGLAVDG